LKEFFKSHPWYPVILIAAAGILLRLLFLLPGLIDGNHEKYLRPDSEFYMYAANALAEGRGYPGSIRAPLFSAVAAGILKTTSSPLAVCAFFTVAGGLTALLVYCAAKEYANHKTGLLAETFYALNLTAIVNAPMLLTDTFFGTLTALQLWLFVLFLKRKSVHFILLTALVAGIGALLRPINMLWFLPCITLIFFTGELSFKRKLIYSALFLLIFWSTITPWMARNAKRGAGFCIDVNTGAMLHQNGAMLLAEVNNTDFESEKAKMLAELDQLFTDKKRFPTEKSKVDYRKKEYSRLIMQHPFIWLKQQFQWKILLPDVPTGFELLGVTSAGRGTMGVLAKHGIWAAVNHYFDGKIYLPMLFLPALLPILVMYLGCAIRIAGLLRHIKNGFFELLMFLAFVEYYLFLPGAITAPRYQIPALPFAVTMAALGIFKMIEIYRKQKEKKS
jgi:4-amino-4-deoxy-L-arabinose transferase-like glycosyltransferase